MTDGIVSVERVRELFHYDPETGHLIRLIKTSNCNRVGDRAGSRHNQGYMTVSIGNRKYQQHRIIWLWVHGEWPENHIDHINGVRSDNRLFNLREATKAQNSQNRHAAHKNTVSGYLGVTWHSRNKKWHARISINRKTYNLGQFDTAEDAHAEYLKAKAVHHPFSTIGSIDTKEYELPSIRGQSSQYIGVHWYRPTKKWAAQITSNGVRYYLGYHQTEELAHQAYLNAKHEIQTGEIMQHADAAAAARAMLAREEE